MNSPPNPAQPGDRLPVFVLGSLFMGIGLIGLLINRERAHDDLLVCSGPYGQTIVGPLHWANFAAGLAYIALFGAWWVRCKRPWDRPNPIAFSRQPWAGREAWQQAVEDLFATLRTNVQPVPLAVLGHGIMATVVAATSLTLISILILCDACPSGLDGSCTASIGSIAGSAFVTLIYYDLRIKFSGGL